MGIMTYFHWRQITSMYGELHHMIPRWRRGTSTLRRNFDVSDLLDLHSTEPKPQQGQCATRQQDDVHSTLYTRRPWPCLSWEPYSAAGKSTPPLEFLFGCCGAKPLETKIANPQYPQPDALVALMQAVRSTPYRYCKAATSADVRG